MTEEQWREIGTQTKLAHNELFILVGLTVDLLPREVVKNVTYAMRCLEQFRELAEEQMVSDGLNHPMIFYGKINK